MVPITLPALILPLAPIPPVTCNVPVVVDVDATPAFANITPLPLK